MARFLKIYDTFIFFNELDLLEIRLNTLNEVVDYFVIVEATKTFQNKSKELYYNNNKKRFEKFKDKIIHIVVDDIIDTDNAWDIEYFNRNCISRGLLKCKDNDKIIVSDLDEIPNPEMLQEAFENSINNKFYCFIQPLYYYYINYACMELDNLPWSIMFDYSQFTSAQEMRDIIIDTQSKILSNTNIDDNVVLINNGGWHFSYLGGVEAIITKIKSYSETQFNMDKYTNKDNILNAIEDGKDLFGREYTFKLIKKLDVLPKYIIDNKLKFDNLIYKEKGKQIMLFDQYSRYNALKQLLNKSEFGSNKTLLDVGCGPECLLGSVLESDNITYVDPLITKQNDEQYINGNIFTDKLQGKKFNYTTAIDVLEHIPLAIRAGFVDKLCELSDEYIIIAFPSSENQDAMDVDNHVNEEYRKIYGKDYPWLEEHFEYGLPSLKDTVSQMEGLGWKCQTIGHGHAPWLKDMLGFTIYAWDILENHDILLEMSEKFNLDFSDYDFSSTEYYRDYIVASKKNLSNIDSLIKTKDSAINKRFKEILDEAKTKVFEKNFSLIQEKNSLIQEKNSLIQEKNSLIQEKNSLIQEKNKRHVITVEETNKVIKDLKVNIEDISKWAKQLQKESQTNLDNHIEVANWANILKARLGKIDNSFLFRNLEKYFINKEPLLNIPKKIIKRLLPNKLLNKYMLYKHKINFDEVKQNVAIHGKIIIAFPIVTWGFRFQRPQHILKELSKKGYTIIYLSLSMSPKGVLFDSIEDAGANVNFTKLDENIYKIWLHSYKTINIYTDHISDENLNNLSLSIQSALKVLKPKEITYMVQFPGWNRLVFDLKSKFNGNVIFDCMDDHSGFNTNDDGSLKEEIELIKNSDIVISSSQLLYDKNIKLNENTIQVKNGTEFEYFLNSTKNTKLDYLSDKPIIGYYGAISDWFDIDIVEYCAKKLPNYNFVMIGATFGCDISKAEQIENIHFLGEIPYKELTGYFAYFDVCVIPFKIIPLTLATNPVKFYEYLSAGKPVVSVKLPELIPYAKYCYLAEDKEEFCVQIEKALNEKSEDLIQERINLAKENSWSHRASTIYKKLEES